jgi:carbon starvation protein
VNTTVDGVLSILFAAMIIIVIADAARVWYGLIQGRKEPEMSETPWQESHLDSEGREIEREPVGAGR